MVVLTNTLPTLVTALPAEHKLRRKLAILSVAPLLAHKICEFAGMPPPDINHLIPTFPLHGGGSAASKDLQPAYLQMMQAQRGGGRIHCSAAVGCDPKLEHPLLRGRCNRAGERSQFVGAAKATR